MGKVKTKLIKRTANTLMDEGIEFSEDFEKNKEIIGKQMPSKKIRNQVAGYISRVKKNKRKKQEKIEKSLKAIQE
ncbi:30S ribosomal protein S17e [Candidatus Pacearchaeota archaeon]|nr:30S ribosomal protein S17e [Candidatus Pacearchaeota archaeon]